MKVIDQCQQEIEEAQRFGYIYGKEEVWHPDFQILIGHWPSDKGIL